MFSTHPCKTCYKQGPSTKSQLCAECWEKFWDVITEDKKAKEPLINELARQWLVEHG